MIRRYLAVSILAALPLATAPAHAAEPPVAPTKVLYIGLENMSHVKAWKSMPYLKGLAAAYGEDTEVSNPADPSLPNYLAQAFGTTFNITDDGNPKHHPNLHGTSVYGAAIANGLTAHVYAQDMVGNCELFDDANGYYKVRHAGGLPYAADERALCQQIMTPMSADFWGDCNAGALPNVGWLAPSNRNNAHRPSTPAQADAWLKVTIPQILACPDFQSGQLVVIVSTDEGSAGDPVVPFVVLHPSLAGATSAVPFTEMDTHRMFLRYGGAIPSGDDVLSVLGL